MINLLLAQKFQGPFRGSRNGCGREGFREMGHFFFLIAVFQTRSSHGSSATRRSTVFLKTQLWKQTAYAIKSNYLRMILSNYLRYFGNGLMDQFETWKEYWKFLSAIQIEKKSPISSHGTYNSAWLSGEINLKASCASMLSNIICAKSWER